MPKAPATTIRFANVVAVSGKPEPYTLWSAPEKDRAFQAALKQHRVMSVHQENTGSKADFGQVGFDPSNRGSLLLFPKSLKDFAGRKVIGVKYDLLAETPEPDDPVEIKPPGEPEPPKREAPEPDSAAAKFLRIFRPEEAEPVAAERPVRQKPVGQKPVGQKPVGAAPVAQKPGTGKRAPEAAPAVEAPAAATEDDASKRALAELTKQVRKAMSQLQAGKAVAAYQTLEKAIAT